MCKLCVFAGTTEGRSLVEFLCAQNVDVTACVATEYGQTLLSPAEKLTISAKRLTVEEMEELLQSQGFDLVIDATHPYATAVTENIVTACRNTATDYLRLLRESSQVGTDAVFVENLAQAVDYLNGTEGNILLTTGSKELQSYSGLKDFTQRVYARVLPMDSSLEACKAVGLKPAHIIAMQGPFSEELNIALLHSVNAKYMVTKDGGQTGGFDEKASAAEKAGIRLVVIGRPPQEKGKSYAQVVELLCCRFGFIAQPVVSVVGIGMGDPKTMTGRAKETLAAADCLIGAKRMLNAVKTPHQTVVDAIAPQDIADYIHNNPQHRRFGVVMSGDVGFFSGTKKLLPLLADCIVQVEPGLSSMVYLCAKVGVSYENVAAVSLHGRNHNIVPDVLANSLVFALVGGKNGIRDLCAALTNAGLGGVQITVGQRLSYPDEIITADRADVLQNGEFDSLSAALIVNPHPSRIVTHGLPDSTFRRGGGEDGVVPMTKSEVRSVCLSKLALTEDAVCWDIGAGTGSVSIEMALQARKGQVYAIERKPEAVELLEKNRAALGVDNLTIVPGVAPDACETLPAPTHIFIGGTAGRLQELLALILAKNPTARIVATAVALESVGELTAAMKQFDTAQTVAMTVARDRKAGPYHLMMGNNPVYIFTFQNGGNSL